MSRRGRVSAVVAAVLAVGSIGAGGVMAASQVGRRGRAADRCSAATADRNIERRVDDLLRKMTLDEKLQQLTLLSDGQMKEDPAEARKPVGGVFSETDPVLINKYQHDAVENSRLHIPILFAFDTIHGFRTVFPIPLGDRVELRSRRRVHRPPDRRVRVGRGRHQADLQPDGRRLARAALGPHLRGRRRGPVPELRDGRRARDRRPGHATTARRTRSSRASSTSSPTASPRAAATTTRPTCPSSGCGTSTCRRSRPRSTPARTP